jgi:hypothetical protein
MWAYRDSNRPKITFRFIFSEPDVKSNYEKPVLDIAYGFPVIVMSRGNSFIKTTLTCKKSCISKKF